VRIHTFARVGHDRQARRGVVPKIARRTWLQVLAVGSILWIALIWATVTTGNINLVPSVIVLGAFLGPVTFVVFVYERARDVPAAL
jgi:hypothetical protein